MARISFILLLLRTAALLCLLPAMAFVGFSMWAGYLVDGVSGLVEMLNPTSANFWIQWGIWFGVLAPGTIALVAARKLARERSVPAGAGVLNPLPPSTGRWWHAATLALAIVVGGGALYALMNALTPSGGGVFAQQFRAGEGAQAKDTEFSVRGCRPEQFDEKMARSGLLSSAWDKDGHLDVRYAIATNCAAPFNYGGYKLVGDKLTLEYSIFWKPTTMSDGKVVVMKTMCTCGYELKYRISALAKKNYSIDIVEVQKR